MKTSEFVSLDGLDMKVTEWDCGCYHEEGYDVTGRVQHLAFQACSACFDRLALYLDNLEIDKGSQLTLPLPSAEGDRERS
jgi:hypothetical protein